MKTKKFFHKKRKLITILSSFLAGAICIMVLPLSLRSIQSAVIQYYQIVVNQQSYGCYETSEEAAKDLGEARKKLAEQQSGPLLTNAACKIEAVERIPKQKGLETSQQELYEVLAQNLEQEIQPAYTIKVNQFTVTVASEGAVLSTLDTIKNTYDTTNSFEIQLEGNDNTEYLTPVCSVRPDVDTGGMESIGFEQQIEVAKAYVAQTEVCDPATAASELIKENETPTIYTVEKGDCLSVIAEKHDMKTKELMELNQLTDSEFIDIGDELVVTVPQPEISVWYKTKAAYEEEYQAEVQYVDNEQWYTGTEQVLQEGTTGRRQVVVEITYSDGKETNREILEETLLEEAQPRIIERGTATPPTFIKPLVGGRFSSPFGSRWGRMHKGIDWSCSIGTAVRASSGGRVVSAGWVNGYGNCITISHSDGKQTRYAHLSKILVSSGTQVKQGEKIALSGNTGNSTGPHVHFEILVDGVQVDPMKYLK